MNPNITLNEIYIVENKIKKEIKTGPLDIRFITINTYPKTEEHVTSK